MGNYSGRCGRDIDGGVGDGSGEKAGDCGSSVKVCGIEQGCHAVMDLLEGLVAFFMDVKKEYILRNM